MFYLLCLLLYAVVSLYALWIFYLAWTNLERAQELGLLSTTAYRLSRPIVWTGLTVDAIVNFTVISLVFLEMPHEWLVSTRLSRHIRDRTWRGALSRWMCRHLLDAFDLNGCHCE